MKEQIIETISKITVDEAVIEQLILKLQSSNQTKKDNELKKHRFTWNRRKTIFSLSGVLLLILGIIIFPFMMPDNSSLSLKIIEKNNYEEYIDFIDKAKQRRPESEPYIFEYNFPVQSVYAIGGVVDLKDSDEYNIKYREYFIASTLLDGSNMTVIYQPKVIFDRGSLVWKEGDGSSYARCDEHLRTYNKRFVLVDKNERKVVGLKFNNATAETIDAMFNYFLTLI